MKAVTLYIYLKFLTLSLARQARGQIGISSKCLDEIPVG